MILADADILARLEEGDLVIEPLADVETQVQPASVDLRLGSEFLEFRRTNIPYVHPNSEREVDDYVSETYVEAGEEFVLHPGDFVLGTTVERVEIPPDLVAHVEGRSSLGRLAVVVHASLPYDEQVLLWTPEDGFGFHEIGAVVEDETPARAVSFDPQTLSVRTHEVTGYITNPTKRIYRVRLSSGREVRLTRDHNLFTIDENGGVERIASEDVEGEWVMVPGRLPGPRGTETELDLATLFESDDDLTVYATDGLGKVDAKTIPRGSRRHYRDRNSAPMAAVRTVDLPADAEVAFKQSDTRLPRHLPLDREFGWILGFYIAEGSARRKQVTVGNRDRDLLDRFAGWFEQYDVGRYRYERDDGVELVTITSALCSKLLRRLCGCGSEKNIPERVWDWPDAVLEGLYEGLVDGDGLRRESRDTLYTANPELADRAMYLGSRLGLLTSTYSRERETYIETSDVHNEGVEHAVDFAPGGHKRGQHVPVPSALLGRLRAEAGLTMAEAASEMGYASKSSVWNVENEQYETVERETLRRFREVYADHGADTTRLDQLLDRDVVFDRVQSVEQTDRVESTYDLEVQPGGRAIENFLGGRGGVFLSNTAGLCDPGYHGQITLELSNLGTTPVALTPGMRVSQLTFTRLTRPADRPYGAERGSKYQDQTGPQASRIGEDPEFAGAADEDEETGGDGDENGDGGR
jgi:dCTP deaminase